MHVDVLLPDPEDPRLIESYAEIKKSLGEKSDEQTLLENVIATTIVCAIINENNKYMHVNVHYSKFLPAFRVDLSENGAILTQDDPNKSAIFFDANSEFHEMLRTTVDNEIVVSRKIEWDKSIFRGRELNATSSNEQTLRAFGIEIGDVQKMKSAVAELISVRPHRYN